MSCATCVDCLNGRTVYSDKKEKIVCANCGSSNIAYDENFYEEDECGIYLKGEDHGVKVGESIEGEVKE